MKNKRLKCSIMIFVLAFLFFFVGFVPIFVKDSATGSDNVSKSLSVPMQMYNPGLDTGYSLTNKVTNTVFSSSAYTSLSVVSQDGDVKKSTYNGFNAFGVTGTSVKLNFKVNHSAAVGKNINGSKEWMLASDGWGKTSGQNVNGVSVGTVASGAIVIQTSSDGKTWSNDNKAKYTNGLYTTDYYAHYGTKEQVIYSPSGADINKGVYIRVLYAYEVYDYVACTHPKKFLGFLWKTGWKHANDNKYANYVEAYSFFLCQNSPESVVFNNLSLKENLEESLEDETTLELVKNAETLKDGSVTVTGFSVGKQLNQLASVSIKKNGQPFTIPSNQEICENGKYDITVKTIFGNESTKTIFVNSKTKDELYSLYFGDSFLTGKRIYSKESLPVFEGGLTYFNLKETDANTPRLWGSLKNKTTGNVLNIEQLSDERKELIIEPGDYEAVLNTNITFADNNPSGDNQSFVFKFKIIENGTAPGPQLNKESLNNFSMLVTPSNLHSTYYGVTFQSAHRGNITLAFATRKAAIDYAYNYEKGMVEVQQDGSFRYNGSLVVSQKTKYDSAWDLTDAIYYFAEQAVQKLRFDLSDEFTFLTLSDEIVSSVKNLRTLELARSVVVFANETEKQALIAKNRLPVVNSKVYKYLVPGEDGEVVTGYNEFVFIKDANGYDSSSVVVIDENGNRFEIEYNKSLGLQLKEYNFSTGIITIEETNIYGDITSYEAVYIAENENHAKVELNCYESETEVVKTIDSSKAGSALNVNAFSIKKIIDETESFGTIIVLKAGVEDIYCFDEPMNKIFTELGKYIVTVVNRMGYSYSFEINISDVIYYTAELSGEGIEGSKYLMYAEGDTVNLPQLSKYGYNFIGYKDSTGQTYSNVVQSIALKGKSVLKTVWKAKEFNLKLTQNAIMHSSKTIVFGETYELPELDSTDTLKFMGWKNAEGELITSLKVEEEGDVTLSAYFEEIEVETVSKAKEKHKLHWLTILSICVVSLILMFIAHYIIVEVSDYSFWMWIISIVLLVVLLVFVNLPWWAISLIEIAGIAISTVVIIWVEA